VDPIVHADHRLPQCQTPILMCSYCDKPTRHNFIKIGRTGEFGAYDHRYNCSVCGTDRRYGLFGA
jgi:hypothetical protein